mgnify:CR=1 FL=1
MLITSVHNPRIRALIHLRERRHREAEGVILIEGADELALALRAGVQPRAVFVCRERLGAAGPPFPLPAGAEVFEVSRPVFEKIAYRENPDGWLAVAPAPRWSLDGLAQELDRAEAGRAPGRGGADRHPPLLLVCEAVEKPGNLGAMLRTADAAGADGVIVCDPATDLGNPNVVRASRGALFSVPVALAASRDALAWLKARGIATVAATPQADRLYTDLDLRGPVALAVGAEDAGLSAAWLEQADLTARIPMTGRVNSLNVAASAALLLYEAVRQRQRGR